MTERSSGFTLDLVSELSKFLLVFINGAVYFSLGFLEVSPSFLISYPNRPVSGNNPHSHRHLQRGSRARL